MNSLLNAADIHAENQQLRENLTSLANELSQSKGREAVLLKQVYALRQLSERLRDKNLQSALTDSERRFLAGCHWAMQQYGILTITPELEQLLKQGEEERLRACINRDWHGPGVVGGRDEKQD